MCRQCWVEDGSPALTVTERTKRGADLISGICERHGGCGAGPLHNVLDDDNWDDASIRWCLDNSIPESDEPRPYRECAEYLLGLSLAERWSAQAIYERWPEVTP